MGNNPSCGGLCPGGGGGGGKLPIPKLSKLGILIENNSDMQDLLSKAKSLVDTAKSYAPKISLYRQIFMLSKAEA